MSDEMDIASEAPVSGKKEVSDPHKPHDCDMELETQSTQPPCNSLDDATHGNCQPLDVPDSASVLKLNTPSDNLLKLNLPVKDKLHCNGKSHLNESRTQNPDENSSGEVCKLSPPVLVHGESFQQELLNSDDSPFQKPSICRTQSVGSTEPPFAIRRRPGKLAFPNQMQSPSAFKRQKRIRSPLRFDHIEDIEDKDLKRCNSAPMLNEMNDVEARLPWHHGSVTPGSVRARRFSATVLSSPSAGTARSTSRLHQLKKEESLEGIQHKEAAHEKEVQTSIQINNTCEELSLSDGIIGSLSSGGDSPLSSPLSATNPVSIPVSSKQCPSRAIDFAPSNPPHHGHHPGGIPSPLTISTGPLSLSPLPPSPTRNLGFSSTGKQCFSPSMQVQLPAQYLRPGSLSPSPSPTRRNFVTRRRSQSPCVLKPSALTSIKRKYDSDSEGGLSPKRACIPGTQINQASNNPGESFQPYCGVPVFPRNAIHRSHSLSSSSVDSVSDQNVSPSPPQSGVNMSFLSSAHHPLGVTSQPREGNGGSLFQPPLHANPFLNTGGIQEFTRCSSPASSTCSSSSLEGLKDMPPFAQNHLISQNNPFASNLLKPPIKELASSNSSNVSSTNVTL